MTHIDRRICMYNATGARVFESPAHVPVDGGWVEHPSLINATKEQNDVEETGRPEDANAREPEGSEERQGSETGVGQEREVLNFEGLDKEALIDIADKASVKIDRRWSRARIEEVLRAV